MQSKHTQLHRHPSIAWHSPDKTNACTSQCMALHVVRAARTVAHNHHFLENHTNSPAQAKHSCRSMQANHKKGCTCINRHTSTVLLAATNQKRPDQKVNMSHIQLHHESRYHIMLTTQPSGALPASGWCRNWSETSQTTAQAPARNPAGALYSHPSDTCLERRCAKTHAVSCVPCCPQTYTQNLRLRHARPKTNMCARCSKQAASS